MVKSRSKSIYIVLMSALVIKKQLSVLYLMMHLSSGSIGIKRKIQGIQYDNDQNDKNG
jgi:hypothetical protein